MICLGEGLWILVGLALWDDMNQWACRVSLLASQMRISNMILLRWVAFRYIRLWAKQGTGELGKLWKCLAHLISHFQGWFSNSTLSLAQIIHIHLINNSKCRPSTDLIYTILVMNIRSVYSSPSSVCQIEVWREPLLNKCLSYFVQCLSFDCNFQTFASSKDQISLILHPGLGNNITSHYLLRATPKSDLNS